MFRGLLNRGRAAQQQAARPAAVPLDRATPRLLTAGDFTAYTPLTGVLSKLATFEVPRGELFELDAARPFRMALKAGGEFEVTSDSSGDATIDLGSEGWELVRSTRPAPAFPTTAHPDVIVLKKADGTPVTIAGIDFATGEVEVAGLGNVATVDLIVYALVGNGEVKLRAVQPAGGVDVVSTELYNETLRALHETDQADGETAPRIMRGARARFPLGPKWLLQVEVQSTAPITLAAASRPVIELHGYRLPVSVSDPAAVNALIAQRLR